MCVRAPGRPVSWLKYRPAYWHAHPCQWVKRKQCRGEDPWRTVGWEAEVYEISVSCTEIFKRQTITSLCNWFTDGAGVPTSLSVWVLPPAARPGGLAPPTPSRGPLWCWRSQTTHKWAPKKIHWIYSDSDFEACWEACRLLKPVMLAFSVSWSVFTPSAQSRGCFWTDQLLRHKELHWTQPPFGSVHHFPFCLSNKTRRSWKKFI